MLDGGVRQGILSGRSGIQHYPVVSGDGDGLLVLIQQGQGAEIIADVVVQQTHLQQCGHQGLEFLAVQHIAAGFGDIREEGVQRGICREMLGIVGAVAARQHVEGAGNASLAVADVAGPEGQAVARVLVAGAQVFQQAASDQILVIHDVEDAAGGGGSTITTLGTARCTESIAVQAGNLGVEGGAQANQIAELTGDGTATAKAGDPYLGGNVLLPTVVDDTLQNGENLHRCCAVAAGDGGIRLCRNEGLGQFGGVHIAADGHAHHAVLLGILLLIQNVGILKGLDGDGVGGLVRQFVEVLIVTAAGCHTVTQAAPRRMDVAVPASGGRAGPGGIRVGVAHGSSSQPQRGDGQVVVVFQGRTDEQVIRIGQEERFISSGLLGEGLGVRIPAERRAEIRPTVVQSADVFLDEEIVLILIADGEGELLASCRHHRVGEGVLAMFVGEGVSKDNVLLAVAVDQRNPDALHRFAGIGIGVVKVGTGAIRQGKPLVLDDLALDRGGQGTLCTQEGGYVRILHQELVIMGIEGVQVILCAVVHGLQEFHALVVPLGVLGQHVLAGHLVLEQIPQLLACADVFGGQLVDVALAQQGNVAQPLDIAGIGGVILPGGAISTGGGFHGGEDFIQRHHGVEVGVGTGSAEDGLTNHVGAPLDDDAAPSAVLNDIINGAYTGKNGGACIVGGAITGQFVLQDLVKVLGEVVLVLQQLVSVFTLTQLVQLIQVSLIGRGEHPDGRVHLRGDKSAGIHGFQVGGAGHRLVDAVDQVEQRGIICHIAGKALGSFGHGSGTLVDVSQVA